MVYNKTIEALNSGVNQHWMLFAKELLPTLPPFCKPVPYQIKKMAVQDAYQAFFTNIRKAKAGKGSFEMHFKSRKNLVQSCFIPSSAIKPEGIYPRISGKGLRYAEELPSLIKDSRLVYERGCWFVCIPTEKKKQIPDNQGRFVAVDPGIRTFATFFSESSFGHIGYHDFGKLVRLCQSLDSLISKATKTNCKYRRVLQRAINRLRWRIKNLVRELHCKTAAFLVKNFDIIFYPTFETQQMVSKSSRKLSRKSVRSMLTYSFYKFAEHLKHKCEETGKILVRVSEAYTSKVNSFTGKFIPNLGSKEFFEHEGYRINRDINGARNILCFSLVDNPCVRNNAAHVTVR